MIGGALPLLILFASVALAFARSPQQPAIVGLAGMIAAAILATVLGVPPTWKEELFLLLWVTTVAACVTTIAEWPKGGSWIIALATAAGACAGTLSSAHDNPLPLLLACPILLLVPLGQWLVRRGWGVANRVVASWLAAAAALAMFVSMTPTPGYVQDHMQ